MRKLLSRCALALVVCVLVATPSRRARAQVPIGDSTATAMRLPVLDDSGRVIPEDLITQRMKPPHWKLRRPIFGALTGMLVFVSFSQPAHHADCSIYDPCTPREKWMMNVAPVVGALVGAAIGVALPDHSVDRGQAIELIRAERRGTPADSARAKP